MSRPPTRTPAAQRAYDAARAGSARRRYTIQRSNAKRRGIEFRLTFEEWLIIWLESGLWAKYGRGSGQYVMARFGDLGVYELGNVKIVSYESNASEASWARTRRKKEKEIK